MYKSTFVCWILLANLLCVNASWGQDADRPFYEYPGDYRQQVNQLKSDFKSRFGYELLDMELSWKPEEIKELALAFSRLPDTFLRIPGVTGIYHFSKLRAAPEGMPVDDIPAATFPSFQTVYRNSDLSYHVEVDDQKPRIEFYNPLFYEDRNRFQNIVQHEMAHIFDTFQGFLSFSKEWMKIAKFSLVHLPALDGRPGDDYLFAALNDPEVKHYAPVSTRQLSTYSRQNLQEDFANSVAAYINYPYFRYSHPERYQYLKDKVFGGKEYFPKADMNYRDKVINDFENAVSIKDWDAVISIAREVGRDYESNIESELIGKIEKTLDNSPDSVRDAKLGAASCYLYNPGALNIRRNLIRKKRVVLQKLLELRRCRIMSRRSFEKDLALWTMRSIYFFKSKGKPQLQFLDPALPVAGARGFETRYLWRVFYEGSNVHVAEGSYKVEGVRSGSIRIDLEKSVVGVLNLPAKKPLILELGAQRVHPREFKKLNSKTAKIRFVIQPGFNYEAGINPDIKVVYPERSEFGNLN
ncbi:MAG: hypothetical protein F3740_02665 [Nitrospinae bacterium]|nr:hypothetical protein [Nitrospinota bacterium]